MFTTTVSSNILGIISRPSSPTLNHFLMWNNRAKWMVPAASLGVAMFTLGAEERLMSAMRVLRSVQHCLTHVAPLAR